jgi:hypothetical protein
VDKLLQKNHELEKKGSLGLQEEDRRAEEDPRGVRRDLKKALRSKREERGNKRNGDVKGTRRAQGIEGRI